MSDIRDRPIVAPVDLARFLVAFGLVPLLLASEFVGRMGPPPLSEGELVILGGVPWSFALVPSWSLDQLAIIALAGVVLGWTASRPAQGLAAVGFGALLGLGVDLWWLAGWVRPEDQSFVSILPQADWRSRLTASALGLLGAVSASFVVGAVVRWLIRERARPTLPEAGRAELIAVAVALIGGPILALGIAAAAASSALVVPDGAQVQTVRVSAGAVAVDPAILRPGSTRFLCEFGLDAAPAYAYLIEIPDGGEPEAVPASFENTLSACGPQPGEVMWATVADLQPGRYVWMQIDNRRPVLEEIATSQAVAVAP